MVFETLNWIRVNDIENAGGKVRCELLEPLDLSGRVWALRVAEAVHKLELSQKNEAFLVYSFGPVRDAWRNKALWLELVQSTDRQGKPFKERRFTGVAL